MSSERRSADDRDLSEAAEHIQGQLERGEEPDAAALAALFALSTHESGELISAAKELRDLEARSRNRPRPQADLRPGERLGGFVIESVLGRGGMATVYRARQAALGGRSVALKVTHEPPGSASQRRLEAEATLASRLHHPNIAELYDFGAERGFVFYAMRLVEGPTLQEVLQRLNADEALRHDLETRRRIARWIAEVAAALEYAHARGLVHRDVKPSNVMLSRQPIAGEALPDCPAILVDFGLVWSRGREATAEALAFGTREYAAPEQHEGGRADPRSDVFSLGATLHDLLTRTLPQLRGSSAAGLPALDARAAGIDADLAAIVGMATDMDETWRYRSAGAFRRDLDAWLAGDPIVARKWSWPRRALWFARKRPARLARGAAVALVLGLAGFAAAMIAGWRADAVAARAEYDAARPVALVDALERLDPMAAGLCLRDPALKRLCQDVHDDAVTNPIETLAVFERDSDVAGALTYAATFLAREGRAAEPFVLRYLCAALRSPAHDGRRDLAISLAARLTYEHPDATIDDVVASGPLRDALRAVRIDLAKPREGDGGRPNRYSDLLALTALSGCGTVEDVDGIMESTMERPFPDEAMRCALACAERILCRLTAMSRPVRVQDRAWWPGFCTFARESLTARCANSDAIPDDVGRTLLDLSVAGLLSQRALGIEPSVSPLLSKELTASLLGERDGEGWRDASLLLAAAGDARLRTWFLDTIPALKHPNDVKDLGFRCGLLADADLAEECEAAVRELEQRYPGAASDFGDGLREARARLRGLRPPLDLDPDSRLERPRTSEPFLEQPTERGDRPAPTAIAAWDFEQPMIRVYGTTRGVEVAALAHTTTDRPVWCLKMAAFGAAAVRLEFEIVGEAPHSATLALDHLVGSRPYYPYGGKAFVEVSIDGEVIDAGLAVAEFANRQDRLRIPVSRLTPGLHSITIRLSERSITTYWLHKAWIETN